MYTPLKRLAARILHVSLEPPEAPAGTVESTVVFRASAPHAHSTPSVRPIATPGAAKSA